jgi:hypothetical protein
MTTATTHVIFGRVPMPERLELHDIVSDGPNSAFDRLGPRRHLGTCTHRMVGSLLGTHGYFQGEAKRQSLTDFGIGGPWDGALDGTIYQWVPRGLDIAPWANGPANDLEGDGIAFVQELGIDAVNRDIRAIELSDGGDINNHYGPAETARQFLAHVELVAYLFDQAETPWDQFPYNPNVGLVTYLEHWEIGPKACPFAPVRAKTTISQNAVRAVLKLHQTGTGTTPEPIPAPQPVPKPIPYSASLDQRFLREVWGEPRRLYRNGRFAQTEAGATKTYPWNPGWTPCSAWIHRAKTEQEFPKPGDWESLASSPDGPVSMIPFSNGWILLRFADRGWRWAE